MDHKNETNGQDAPDRRRPATASHGWRISTREAQVNLGPDHSGTMSLTTRSYGTNTTSPAPATDGGDAAVGYVLVPFFLVTVIGIAVAVILYIRRKQRIDRLRHQLLPVYTYDPSEELNEAEQELLWKEDDTKVVQGWARSYQQRRPLLAKDVHA